ncbi:Uncharacterised protein [Serratia fonticola]|nr:Uncharacterised protein [Serratia fonticola]
MYHNMAKLFKAIINSYLFACGHLWEPSVNPLSACDFLFFLCLANHFV